MRKLLSIVVTLGTLLLTSADAQQICCSGGRSGGGSVSFPLTAPNGTSAAPSYSFANGADSGMFASANGSVSIVGSKPLAAAGGSVTLTGGTPTAGNNSGGGITLGTGSGVGTGGSGAISITTANALNTGSGAAGSIIIQTGNAAPSGSADAGNISIIAGSGFNTPFNRDGSVTITAGNGTGNPGTGVTITGGNNGGNSAGYNGVTINSGPSTAASNILIQANGGTNSANNDIALYNHFADTSHVGGSTKFSVGATSGPVYAHVSGLVNASLTSAGNGADVSEDILQSYTLGAFALDSVGRCVRITSWGTTAANADTKVIRVYFGASLISSGISTFNSVNWVAHMVVCKTGSSTQSVIADMTVGTTVLAPMYSAGTENDGSAIVIKTTGQAGTANANDIISKGQIVEFMS